MRHWTRLFVLCLTLSLLVSLPAWAGDGTFSAEERRHIVELLETSRSELESLAAQADASAWNQRTDPERWSVGEVVEHLVLAEEAFHGMITGALAGEPNPDWKAVAAAGVEGVETLVQDRSQKFQAPEGLVPSGKWERDEALARYAKARARLLDVARSTDAAVKQFTIEGPPGTMNVQQWMALAGAHNLRHNQQIQDVLSELE